MIWPFKRKPKKPDVWDDAERNLIAQGLDPRKVRRAAEQARKWDQMGRLPFNLDRSDEKGPNG